MDALPTSIVQLLREVASSARRQLLLHSVAAVVAPASVALHRQGQDRNDRCHSEGERDQRRGQQRLLRVPELLEANKPLQPRLHETTAAVLVRRRVLPQSRLASPLVLSFSL